MQLLLRTSLLCLIALCLRPGSALQAATPDTVFARSYRVGEVQLPLRGAGSYQYLLWKLYDAALYLPHNTSATEVLDPQTPRALKIIYEREISAQQFIKSSVKILGKNYTSQQLEAIQAKLNLINSWYEDVKAGDSYDLVYQPDKGTSLIRDGNILGTIPGGQFASIYFSIWLGPKAKCQSLNQQLCAVK